MNFTIRRLLLSASQGKLFGISAESIGTLHIFLINFENLHFGIMMTF